ncbi:hypothetical protein [Thalassolituus oleivorans]|uniref:hypothetical protein n=1 Tax=Thalassolituus oleivorans TaxID=187493 RepID=UPI00240A9111|nr:hypothetical protein [Thalassolituus oleivorans]MDF1641918.1 hypothetical protein [Thalassolituus oleivorans]
MNRTKAGRFGALATVLFTALTLSGCDKNNSSNPDFNQDVLFTDYGTYGRTVYFTDDEGQQWCYYDVLTINNSSTLKLTISSPVKGECNLDKSIYLRTDILNITGESVESSQTVNTKRAVENSRIFNIATTASGASPKYDTYPSNGNFSADNKEYQQAKKSAPGNQPLTIIPFNGIDKTSVTTLRIMNKDDDYLANRISYIDYISLYGFLNSEMSIEVIYTVYYELLYTFGIPLYTTPEPALDIPYPVVGLPDNREDVYRASPYQRLTPSDDDPYPLIQIATE